MRELGILWVCWWLKADWGSCAKSTPWWEWKAVWGDGINVANLEEEVSTVLLVWRRMVGASKSYFVEECCYLFF